MEEIGGYWVVQREDKSLPDMLCLSTFSKAASEICLTLQGFVCAEGRLTAAFAQQCISSPLL